MAKETIVHPGRPGTWPNGEPQSVRDAYDAMITDQNGNADETDR